MNKPTINEPELRSKAFTRIKEVLVEPPCGEGAKKQKCSECGKMVDVLIGDKCLDHFNRGLEK